MEKVKRRNLSGVYLFHKFEDEDNREPTCFEDCPVEEQDRWLEDLGEQAIIGLAKHLASTLREIGDKFNLIKD